MGAVWYTSDLHFGHRRVSDIRGFGSTLDHDAAICGAWINQVGPDDTVYVLGDIAVSGFTRALDLIDGLPGRKHLIAGNHDPVHPMHRAGYVGHFASFTETFDTVQPFQRRRLAGVEFALSHFPYESWGDGEHRTGNRYPQWRLPDLGMPLLHGHTHGTERDHGHMLHVGWDAWGALVSQETVIDWLSQLPEAAS